MENCIIFYILVSHSTFFLCTDLVMSMFNYTSWILHSISGSWWIHFFPCVHLCACVVCVCVGDIGVQSICVETYIVHMKRPEQSCQVLWSYSYGWLWAACYVCGAGTQILWKSRKQSELLSYLSISNRIWFISFPNKEFSKLSIFLIHVYFPFCLYISPA